MIEYINLQAHKPIVIFNIAGTSHKDYENALSYSYLKFGHGPTIDRFSSMLIEKISACTTNNIIKEKDKYVVLNPGGSSRIPNASFLLASKIAKEFSLPHFSLTVPLTLSEQKKYGTQSRACYHNWHVLINQKGKNFQWPVLKNKRILFIDDCIFTGRLYKKVFMRLAKERVENLQCCIVAHFLDTDNPFYEKIIDTLAIASSPIFELSTFLNNKVTTFTTRLLHHTFNLSNSNFKELLRLLSPEVKLKLYLTAIPYFGSYILSNISILSKAIHLELGLKLPDHLALNYPRTSYHYDTILNSFQLSNDDITLQYMLRIATRVNNCMVTRRHFKIKFVVFDLDHTLCFSDKYYKSVRLAARKYISQKYNLPIIEVKNRINNLRDRLSNKGLFLRQSDVAEEFSLSLSELDRAVVTSVDASRYIKKNIGLRRIIEGLKSREYCLAVLTNSPFKQSINILRALDILDCFEYILSPNNLPFLKPDPRAFKTLLKNIGAQAKETLMVGNSRQMDLVPAQKHGMPCLLIRYPEQLESLPSVLSSHNEVDLQITNLLHDLQGFREDYNNPDHDQPPEMVFNSFLQAIRFSFSRFALNRFDLFVIHDRLSEAFYKLYHHNTIPATDVSHERVRLLNRLIDSASKVVWLTKNMSEYPNRVYLGTDALFWLAADPKAEHYFIDGFTLLSHEEYKVTRPFFRHLLPEHNSIVYQVMNYIIENAIKHCETTEDFDKFITKNFLEEIRTARIQRLLADNVSKRIEKLKKNHDGIYQNYQRQKYLSSQIHLLRCNNTFKQKVREITSDLKRQPWFHRIVELVSHATLIDSAISGTQPLFLKCCLATVDQKIGEVMKCKLIISKNEHKYYDRNYDFLFRFDLPSEIEKLRPIVKDRQARNNPNTPVFVLNTPQKQLEGILFAILLAIGSISKSGP
jgi:phosphoglycolate phosphatase